MRVSPTHALRTAVELTKARLVSLVLVTTAVGFVLASQPPLDWGGLAWALLGTGLAAAGVMSINQGMEWRRDARMLRTLDRPVPRGDVSPRHAVAFGGLLSATGIATLALLVNELSALLGLAVIVFYVAIYTPLKTRSTLCTLAGAVCGALPPMMGWAAAAGRLELGAYILAVLLFLWQIPHFLALAWLYREDYERGGFRMLPSIDPSGTMTGSAVVVYCLALLPVGVAAALSGVSGWLAAAGSLAAGLLLLRLGVELARVRSDASARRLFLATLAYLPLLLAMMVADRGAARPLVAASGAPAMATEHPPGLAEAAARE